MKNYTVKLSTIDDVRSFVTAVTRFEGDLDLSSGRYVIDAKSIMGIFSLDLSQPITLTCHSENTAALEVLIKPFLV